MSRDKEAYIVGTVVHYYDRYAMGQMPLHCISWYNLLRHWVPYMPTSEGLRAIWRKLKYA